MQAREEALRRLGAGLFGGSKLGGEEVVQELNERRGDFAEGVEGGRI